MAQGSEVIGFHQAECAMISSSNLVRPKVTSSNGRAMGRYEHKNRYQVLGADAEDEDDESEDSLAEPLVDTDVEV